MTAPLLVFHCIEKAPDTGVFWRQSAASWVSLLDCDHYASAEEAVALVGGQPYMQRFFQKAVLRTFTIHANAEATTVRLMDAVTVATRDESPISSTGVFLR